MILLDIHVESWNDWAPLTYSVQAEPAFAAGSALRRSTNE